MLRTLTIAQTAAALRRGDFTCVQLVEHALRARARVGGAYRTLDDVAVMARARAVDAAFQAGYDLGPLMGIPVSVKDLFGVPGFPTHAGSPRRLPSRWQRPGPVVEALLRQMAVVVGKTHTVEFAFGGLGTNPHVPTPHNPWDRQHPRVPGGSSAGAGVSLAEGSAMLALGTDTAGSVRVPASFTGNLGLKTTHGRWSTEGVVPLSPSLDTVGILARSLADLRLAFTCFDPQWRSLEHLERDGPTYVLPGLRIGRCDELFWNDCSPGVVEAVESALRELHVHGARVRPLALPEVSLAFGLFQRGGPVAAELHRFLSSELPEWIPTLDPNVGARISDAARLSAADYLERKAQLQRWSLRADHALRAVDVLVAPTVALSPPRLDEVADPHGYGPRNLLVLRNPSVVSYLGLCALTVPVGLDRLGLPVGLMLVARAHREADLLAIARVVEPHVIAELVPPR